MAEGAYGIQFEYSSNDGGAYTALGEITDLTPPSITKDTIETTHHGSSGIKSYIGGLVDFGEVSVTVNYDPDGTDDIAIRNLAKTANETVGTKQYRITYASGSTEIFDAIVTGFEQEAPIDGKLSATFTLKVTGAVTYSTT